MIQNEEITENCINAIIDKKVQYFEEVRPFIVKKIIEVYSILNYEQRQKAADLLEKRIESRQAKRF